MTSIEQARDIQMQLIKWTSSELSDMAEKENLTLAWLVICMTYTTINCILFEELIIIFSVTLYWILIFCIITYSSISYSKSNSV